jgi:ATP-binding cassette subfamily B protein
VRDPAILILDEATSALDPATEAAFIRTLKTFAHDRTVISVTHRLSSVTGADQIIVLDGGRLRAQGTHQELLLRSNLYRRLWEQQTGFEITADGQEATISPDRLRQVPLFAATGQSLLAELAREFQSRVYDPGEIVIREGEEASEFYIVVRGSLEVWATGPTGQNQHVSVEEDGDFFGEIGLLHGVPRTATVRALTQSLVLVLPRGAFERLMQTAPDLRGVVEQLATRRLERASGTWSA